MNTSAEMTYDEMVAEHEARTAELQKRALKAPYTALFRIAVRAPDTGGGGTCLRLLLSLHNGSRYKFDLTDLRRLDAGLHAAAIAVLSQEIGFADYISARIAAETENDQDEIVAILERLGREWGGAA